MKKYILRMAALSLAAIMLLTSSGFALTLRYPERGNAIAELQQALYQLKYYTQTVDGIFGNGTRTAVRTFQKANGLTVDGVAGPKTLARIEELTGIQVGGSSSGGSSGDTPTITEGVFSGNYSTIEYGAKGDRVRILQRALDALGYSVGKIDGSFGSATNAAVKAFQKAEGLTVDGKAGKKTLKELETYFDKAGNLIGGPIVPVPPTEEEDKNDYDVPTRTLRQGMTGQDVQYSQQRLYTLGYYTGARDGEFGSGMLSAVKAFQRRHGLTVDGVIGPATRKILFSSDALYAEDEEEKEEVEQPDFFRTLTLGMEGEDVATAQMRLKVLGYFVGTANGVYDVNTMSAMMVFQARNGLTANGECNAATAARLYSDDAIRADEEIEEETPPALDTETIPTRTLRYGYTGDDVKVLQNRLKALGYFSGTADGTFGSSTLTAVKNFQKNNNLSVDGVAGAQTYKKLFSDSAVEADPEDVTIIPERSLTIGDTGDDVKSVQKRLRQLGYYSGTADGTYGSATTSAMLAFQRMNGLNGTGNGNMATYARLFSDDALTDEGVKLGESSPGYTNLRLGATGAAVTRLQQKLDELKYDVTVNGTYDEQTYNAVLAFQKLNGLSADGVAGKVTQTKLYSGDCVTGDNEVPSDVEVPNISTGNGGGPNVSQVKWLMWYDEIKPQLGGSDILLVYEPSTNTSYRIRVFARGRHLDAEPYTLEDTALMKAAWGGTFSWNEKPVYVRLPSGVWCIASTHSMPHEENGLVSNGFYGHLCVHFPRTLEETIAAGDDKNGVRHQNDIRKHWLKISGENITW